MAKRVSIVFTESETIPNQFDIHIEGLESYSYETASKMERTAMYCFGTLVESLTSSNQIKN